MTKTKRAPAQPLRTEILSDRLEKVWWQASPTGGEVYDYRVRCAVCDAWFSTKTPFHLYPAAVATITCTMACQDIMDVRRSR